MLRRMWTSWKNVHGTFFCTIHSVDCQPVHILWKKLQCLYIVHSENVDGLLECIVQTLQILLRLWENMIPHSTHFAAKVVDVTFGRKCTPHKFTKMQEEARLFESNSKLTKGNGHILSSMGLVSCTLHYTWKSASGILSVWNTSAEENENSSGRRGQAG